MTSKRLNGNNNIMLNISRTILAIVLIFSIYTFFDKEPITAKLLAAGGSILLLFLLIMSFTSAVKSKKQ